MADKKIRVIAYSLHKFIYCITVIHVFYDVTIIWIKIELPGFI